MIVTVTLNAAIDKRYVVEKFQEGEVNRVKECAYTPGGKGLNVSKPLALLGCEVVATGFVGGHAGDYIVSETQKKGIRTDFYRLAAESRSCINIWDESQKKQTEFLEPGFTVPAEAQSAFLEKFRELTGSARVVAMSGSVPKGVPATYYQELVRIAKERGQQVILDTSGELLVEGIKAKPTMIKPNIDEIRLLTGQDCREVSEIVRAARELQHTGIAVVVVSLGADGSVMACDDGVFQAVVPRIAAVNTVGCGDSMIAGFACAFDEGLSPLAALRKASAVSAAAAMTEQTGFFRLADMQELMKQIEVKQL